MTLIVAPAAGAESYCSVAHADTYHYDRGTAAWVALTAEQKEQALRRATDYMTMYTLRWSGARTTLTQSLDWPRVGVVVNGWVIDHLTVPDAVQNACALLALKAHTTDLAPDLGPQKLEVTVGPITTRYAPGTRQSLKFQAVDAMLVPYLAGSAGIQLVRA